MIKELSPSPGYALDTNAYDVTAVSYTHLQEYAAEKAGISYSYYTKIERGQQLPSLEVAMVLSKTFSLSMDRWLLSQAHDYRMSPAALNLIQYVSSLDNKTIETIQELLSKASLVEKQN